MVAVIAARTPKARLRTGAIVGARFVRYCCMKGLLSYSTRSQLVRNRIRAVCVRIMSQAFRGNSNDSRMFMFSLSSLGVILPGAYCVLPKRSGLGDGFLEVVTLVSVVKDWRLGYWDRGVDAGVGDGLFGLFGLGWRIVEITALVPCSTPRSSSPASIAWPIVMSVRALRLKAKLARLMPLSPANRTLRVISAYSGTMSQRLFLSGRVSWR